MKSFFAICQFLKVILENLMLVVYFLSVQEVGLQLTDVIIIIAITLLLVLPRVVVWAVVMRIIRRLPAPRARLRVIRPRLPLRISAVVSCENLKIE